MGDQTVDTNQEWVLVEMIHALVQVKCVWLCDISITYILKGISAGVAEIPQNARLPGNLIPLFLKSLFDVIPMEAWNWP